jgi:hypothetical protein
MTSAPSAPNLRPSLNICKHQAIVDDKQNNGYPERPYRQGAKRLSGRHENHRHKAFDGDAKPVCTENLSSGVVVVKSAKDGLLFDTSDSLNLASDRRILVQGSMRSNAILIVGVGFQGPDANASRLRQ